MPLVSGLDVLAQLDTQAAATSYRARRYGVDYTLTVLGLDRRDRAGTLRRLHREAALLAAIGHPRLPGVHEVGVVGGRPYLVTDLVPGRPLADLIAGDPLPVPQAIRLVLDVVEPLAAMHRQGLVHRDLSSRRLIVLEDGSARLLDAGIGRGRPGTSQASKNQAIPGQAIPSQDGTGRAGKGRAGAGRAGTGRAGTGRAGTARARRARAGSAALAAPSALGYLAPEQSGALARPVDNRTDLYSLGVVLFECLTGTLPFLAAERSALAELQAMQAAPDPRTRTADLPESLAMLVTTLLAREPGDRYQSAEELAADLRLLLGEPLPDVDGTDPGDAPAPLGRERELDLIDEVWDQVRHGRGRGIAVRGVSGVGKTRLTDEVLRRARRTGAPVLALSCRPDEPEPFAPLRRAVENLLLDADALPVMQRNQLHAQLRTAAGSAAPLLAGLSPALAGLLGAAALPDADRQEQFAAAVGRFILDLARLSGGLLLVTDDAHLVDSSTFRVISQLAPDLGNVPLLSIGSFRTDQQLLSRQDPLMPAILAATDLDLVLEPLDRPGVDGLLRSRLPGIDLDSDLAQELREHSGGNPFVLLEHLDARIDSGVVRPHWGSWLLDPGGQDLPRLPQDPLGLALAGLEPLDPAARRVLVVAAVTGMRVRPTEIAEIGELDPDVTFWALAEAASRRFVELAGNGDYRFRHERIREALLDGLDADESARLHQSIAEVLGRRLEAAAPAWAAADVYLVAQHYLLGTPSGPGERAFDLCRAAGRLAMRAHAPDRAATFLEHADRLRPGDARLLHTLGTALHRAGRYPAAQQRLEEALAVERDWLRRARILLRLTDVHRATRNTRKALMTIEWGLAELDAPLPAGGLLRALGALRAGLVALLVSVTGWRLGAARSRNRERQDLLAALHLAGGHLAAANLWPARLVMHRLYGARAAVRVGAGLQYSLSCAAMALTAARYGFGRLRRYGLALAEQSAADLADPQLAAQIAWYAGAADYLGRVDNGERWITCLADHGPWLETEQFSETIAALCWDAAVQGRDDDVLRWAESGRARRSFSDTAEPTSMLTIPAIGLAAAGRPAAANAELRRVRTILEQPGGRSLKLDLVLAELYALLQQDHVGEHFDAVAERFFDFKLSTTGMLRQHQSFFVLYAQGRLAQCRAAQSTSARPPTAGVPVSAQARLDAARIAVRQLRSVARTPLLRAAHQQCRAELLVLQGRPKRALALLSRLTPRREEAPLISFEIARTTARALLAAGYPADARRHVLSAMHLAEEHGWAGRRTRLGAEFGLRSAVASLEAAQALETALAQAQHAAAPAAAVSASASRSTTDPAGPGTAPDEAAPYRALDLAADLRDTLLEMSAAADPVEVLRRLVVAAGRVLPGGHTWVIRPAPRVLGGGTGSPAEVLFSELPCPGSVSELIFDPELRTLAAVGQPVVGDPHSAVPAQLRRLLATSASWLLLPLICDGVHVGVLVLASSKPQAYADTEIAVAGALAAQGMAAHAKAGLIARLQELTGTDELTGVRSLRQIVELATRDLQAARHSSRALVVMVIGIDHLGRINDLHGRAGGDDVIRQVAMRLGQVIRDTDLIGRYRQDEFVVVLSQGRDGEDGIGDGGLEVAERLLSTISRTPVETRVGPVPVTVTIGLTLMTKDDTNITTLAARAEVALNTARQGGGNQVSGT